MSYHIKDLIADLSTIEKAELLIDSIDLLTSVGYDKHVEKLEDILMTIDANATADSLNLIEAVLLTSLADCCGEYGLYIFDDNPELFNLNKMNLLVTGFFDIITDESKQLIDVDELEEVSVEAICDLLDSMIELDISEIAGLIKDISDDLLIAIEENTIEETLGTDLSNYNIKRRLKETNIISEVVHIKEALDNFGIGFDFKYGFVLIKNELMKIKNIEQRAIEYTAILLASSVENSNLSTYLNETIDEIGETDDEISNLRIMSKKLLPLIT